MRGPAPNVIFMAFLGSLALFLSIVIQTGAAPPAEDDVFSPAEKSQLAMANTIDRRIKIYEAASKRIQQTLQAAVGKEDFGAVPNYLKQWTSLLAKSLEDIEANLKSKKKSRNLISYEIQVRKSIAHTQSLKIRAPIDQQDDFDSCLSSAEAIRKKLVEILFQH